TGASFAVASHLLVAWGAGARTIGGVSGRHTRTRAGSSSDVASGGVSSALSARQIAGALVVRSRRAAVGCAAKVRSFHISGAKAATSVSVTTAPLLPSKASLSAFSSAARSASTGYWLYGAFARRNSGGAWENQRRFGCSDGRALT